MKKHLTLIAFIALTFTLGAQTVINYDKIIKIYVGDKQGLVTVKGDTIAAPVYDYIYEDGRFRRAGVDSKMIIINNSAKKQKPLKYDTYGFSVLANGVIARVEMDRKVGFVDSLGEEIIPPIYSDFKDFSLDGLIAVCTGEKYSDEAKKWGLFNLKGKEVLPVSYEVIGPNYNSYEKPKQIDDGILLVKMNGKYGFVSISGKAITPLKYDRAESFSKGLAHVEIKVGEGYSDYKHGFVNVKGKELIPLKYDEVSLFDENGLAKVGVKSKQEMKYGFIDRNGREVVPIKYESADFVMKNQLIRVMLNNKYGLIDREGKKIIPIKYDLVDYDIKSNLVLVQLNDKYGFVDLAGKEVVSPRYANADSFKNGFAIVADEFSTGTRLGVIDSTGKTIIPLIYKSISEFNHQRISQVKDSAGKLAYINTSGILITKFYDDLESVSYFPKEKNDFTFFSNKSKTGLIDNSGKEVIPALYDEIEKVSLNKFHVVKNGLHGIIDINNKEIIPIKFSNPISFRSNQITTIANIGGHSNGFANIIGGKWGIIDSTGKTILPFDYEAIGENVSDGFIPAKFKGKWGYINSEGKRKIPFIYDLAGFLGETEGVGECLTDNYYALPVVSGKKYLIIDTLGKVMPVDYTKAKFSKSLCAVTILNETGFINNKGQVVLPFRYGDGFDGFASDSTAWCGCPFGETKINTKGEYITFGEINAVEGEKKKYGMVDKKGNILVDAKYDDMNIIDKTRAIVSLNRKYGMIDKKGKELIPLIYDEIEYYDSDTMKVLSNGKFGLVDALGKEIVPVKYDDIEYNRGNKTIKVQLKGKYGLLNSSGKEILPPIYDEIQDFAEGKVEVQLNGRTFYLDEKGNEVN
jgi:hypothetical protein